MLVLAKKGVSINREFRQREIKPVSSSQALHQLKVVVELQPCSSFLQPERCILPIKLYGTASEVQGTMACVTYAAKRH